MIDFIGNSPPETTFFLGLTTGALIGETIKKIARQRANKLS
jgi:hypothetical protein